MPKADMNSYLQQHPERKSKGAWKYLLEPYKSRGWKTVIPFSTADMELPVAPAIQDAITHAMQEPQALGYVAADAPYLQSVCNWVSSRQGWAPQPHWIVVTPGVVAGLKACVEAVSEVGDTVIYMPPVYPPFKGVSSYRGRSAREVPLLCTKTGQEVHYDLDFDRLEEEFSNPRCKACLLCSPHNPIGRIWTRGELEHLFALAVSHDVFLIIDEIHADLIMPGHHFVSAGEFIDRYPTSCMIAQAATKTFNLSGILTAHMFVANDDLREKIFGLDTKSSLQDLNFFARIATMAAYAEGGEWLSACLQLIHGNNKLLIEFLQEHFEHIRFAPLEGTYLQWLDWTAYETDGDKLEQSMIEDAQLFLDEGKLFGPLGCGFERWNLACPTAVLQAALDRTTNLRLLTS